MKKKLSVFLFIIFFLFNTISIKAEVEQQSSSASKSKIQIIIDFLSSLFSFSTSSNSSQNQTSGGGSGGTTSNKTLSPLPNLDENSSENNKILADALLNNLNVDLSCYTDSCGRTSYEVVKSLSNNQLPIVCSNGCSCPNGGPNGNVTMNARVLQGLVELSKTESFCVTALTNAIHSSSSTHYDGNAADIDVSGKSAAQQISIRNQLQSYCGWAICETDGGGTDPSCESTNHIHWTCAAGTD